MVGKGIKNFVKFSINMDKKMWSVKKKLPQINNH